MASRVYRHLQIAMIHATEQGGAAALRYFRKKVLAVEKAPRDFVTEADKQSEARIIGSLRKAFPNSTILGEESGLDRRDSEIQFIIDPLDATTNFMLGSPEWSIMVAATYRGNLVAAVILLPVMGELFTARLGEGAFLNRRRIRIAQVDNLDGAVVSLNRSNFPSEILGPSAEAFRRIITNCKSFRDLGTAGVEYSRLASGVLHGIVTPIGEEVHSAGYLLMSEAGAFVTDISGQPIAPNSKTVVAASPILHPKLLGMLDGLFTSQP